MDYLTQEERALSAPTPPHAGHGLAAPFVPCLTVLAWSFTKSFFLPKTTLFYIYQCGMLYLQWLWTTSLKEDFYISSFCCYSSAAGHGLAAPLLPFFDSVCKVIHKILFSAEDCAFLLFFMYVMLYFQWLWTTSLKKTCTFRASSDSTPPHAGHGPAAPFSTVFDCVCKVMLGILFCRRLRLSLLWYALFPE